MSILRGSWPRNEQERSDHVLTVQLKSSKSTAPDSSPETTQESPQASIPNSNGQPAPVPTCEFIFSCLFIAH